MVICIQDAILLSSSSARKALVESRIIAIHKNLLFFSMYWSSRQQNHILEIPEKFALSQKKTKPMFSLTSA